MTDNAIETAVENAVEIVTAPVKGRGNDRRAEAMREVIDRLIGAVDVDNDEVDEYNMLGSLLVRADLAWRCLKYECRCINHNESNSCDNCGGRKPRNREIPKAEW